MNRALVLLEEVTADLHFAEQVRDVVHVWRTRDEPHLDALKRVIKQYRGVIQILDDLAVPGGGFSGLYKGVDVVAILREKLGLPPTNGASQ